MRITRISALAVALALTGIAALLAPEPVSARSTRHRSHRNAHHVVRDFYLYRRTAVPADLLALGGGLKDGALAAGAYEYDARPYGYAYGYPTPFYGFGYFPDDGRR